MLELDGVEFYFTTLWSKCNSNLIEDYITDFKICFWGDEKYRWTHHNQFHQRAVEWLDENLSKPKSKPRVVVSHFVPSNEVNAYPDSDDLIIGPMIKSYFVAQLDEYLKKWDIDYWIYGHNHWNNDVDVFSVLNFDQTCWVMLVIMNIRASLGIKQLKWYEKNSLR